MKTGIVILFLLLPFIACTQKGKETLIKKNVTISGIALHTKGGPSVETDSCIYYIHHLTSWPKDRTDKKVTVKGDLYRIAEPAVKDGELYQAREYYFAIKNASFKY